MAFRLYTTANSNFDALGADEEAISITRNSVSVIFEIFDINKTLKVRDL